MRGKNHIQTAYRAMLGCFALGGAIVSTSAHANIHGAALQPAVVAAALQHSCANRGYTRMAEAGPTPASVVGSKSAAILGGEMSALERMRLEQSGQVAEVADARSTKVVEPLQPAAGGTRGSVSDCALKLSGSITLNKPSPRQTTGKGDFLASKRVSIQKTAFDNTWARVDRETVAGARARGLVSSGGDPIETVASVNRWVNNRIAYVEDRALFGQGDYWAGARQTLSLQMGDCEDFALTKLQILAASGIPREDMFLTIAKDTVRRMDHAVLVVRIDDRFVVLDNTTDELLDGSLSHDYVPVLSFGATSNWLHGY